MKELYKMTKEELIATCRKLQSENERLQDELDNLSDCYTELENDLAYVVDQPDIADLDHFKYRLQLDGLLTPQIESFIEDYLKYYDVGKG